MNRTTSYLNEPTVMRALHLAESRLKEAGVTNEAWEARELLACAMPCHPMTIVMNPGKHLSDTQWARLTLLLSMRCQRRPLAYVLGEWDFMDYRLTITKDVLVPRPETEGLVELVLRDLEPQCAAGRSLVISDVGTGSGCIAIALAKKLSDSMVLAIDLSPRALVVARKNVLRHGLSQRIMLIREDLLSHLLDQRKTLLDAVIANLPYVRAKEMDELSPEVQCEPAMALTGGRDGLNLVRRLLPQAMKVLKPGGAIYLEIGHDQSDQVVQHMLETDFHNVRVEKDLAGRRRYVIGQKR